MKQKSWVDIGKINKKLKTLGSGKFLKFQEGNNKFRIIPRMDDSGLFYHELTQHYGFKDEQRGRAYACLFGMENKPCPICQFQRALETEGGNDNVVKEIRATTGYLCNVVDRADNSIKVLSLTSKMLRGIFNYLTDDDYGDGILDPEKGNDFTITRTGTGFTTKYSEPRISPKQTPIGIEDWEEKVHNIEKEIEILSFDELVKILESNYGDHIEELGLKFKNKGKKVEEEDDGDDEEAEEESPPAKRSSKDQRKRSSKQEADEGEDGDSEESDEELSEDDEAPTPKGKKVKAKKEDDDEEDDFFDDDEEEEIEEDEAPKKKKARK